MSRKTLYTEQHLKEALHLVKNENVCVSTASKMFGIPYSTIREKLTGRRPINPKSKYLLSDEEEEMLVLWIKMFAERGLGRNYEDVRNKVAEILMLRNADSRCKDGKPSKDWMKSFLKRHVDITLRSTQSLGKERGMVSAEKIKNWFSDLKSFVEKEDPSLLRCADRIFNADETGFALSPKPKRVLAEKGTKHVYQLTNNTKQQMTVLACASAFGEYVPPLIIYPRKRLPSYNIIEGYENSYFQLSANGWMNSTIFSTWLKDTFAPFVTGKKKPILLLVDGHTSHNTDLESLEFCRDEGIILYGILPHASHILQPLDLSVFGSCKSRWNEICKKNLEETGETASQQNFARLLKMTTDQCFKPELIINGFVKSGIFPFNPSKAFESGKMESCKNFFSEGNTTNQEKEIEQPATSHSQEENSSKTSKFSELKDLLKFAHEIGIGQSLTFIDMVQDKEAPKDELEEEIFKEFKSKLDKLYGLGSKEKIQTEPTSLKCQTKLADLFSPPTVLQKPQKPQQKKHKSMSMAFSSLEYRDFLKKKQDDIEELKNEKERKKEERQKKKERLAKEKEERRERVKIAKEKKRLAENEKKLKKLLKNATKKVRKSDSESNEEEMIVESDGDESIEMDDPNCCKECGKSDGPAE